MRRQASMEIANGIQTVFLLASVTIPRIVAAQDGRTSKGRIISGSPTIRKSSSANQMQRPVYAFG
jgi:hypothetical protein